MHLTRAFRHAGRSFATASSLSILLLANATAAAQSVPVLPDTLGEQKTAVILVNFNDAPTQPVSVAGANDLVFGTVSDLFWEASYKKTFLSGDTFGWFTIPLASTSCDKPTIEAEGNKAATAAGANLSGYKRIVYMFPTNTGCAWSGIVSTNSSGQKLSFINNGFNLYVVAHEMGHGFGLQHADSQDCDVDALGDTCVTRSYGDRADTMGSVAAHFNAFNKERLGWLDAGSAPGAPAIATVSASGRYTLAPFETADSGVKALKVLKSIDPVSGKRTWYYIEHRRPIGFDLGLASIGNLARGVLVRTGMMSGTVGTSVLLDMTPNSDTSSSTSDLRDAALEAGRRFADPDAGVAITLVSADESGAVVDVVIGSAAPAPAPICTRAAPQLALTGPTSSVAAGSTVHYTLNLTNKDSSACASTTFNLAHSVPGGWNGSLAASTLSLSAGASASTTLSVTSAGSAAAGNYGIGAGAGSSLGGVHTANASATYSVAFAAGSGVLTETVGTDKVSYVRGETVYMSALVRKDGVAVNGASVKFTLASPGAGTAMVSATSGSDGFARGSYKLGKGKGAAGDYTLRADASVGSAATTATAGFSVR